MKHMDLWRAIDTCACKNAMSCSRLAIKSGLSSTTFNKSKRCDKNGKPRWPSVSTLVKMLKANNISFTEFAKLIPEDRKK